MSDTNSSSTGLPGIGDLLAMFGFGGPGGTNPLASIGKTIEQFKRGVNDFLVAVENFNETMQTMNAVANRVNALLEDVEQPLRALLPQITRSVTMADAMINQISGPIEQVAPGIVRLADTLSSPLLTTMPAQLGEFVDTLGDVARRMQPLAQMAENAGSLFGLRNPFASNRPAPAPQTPVKKAPATKAPAKKAPATKAPAKRAPAAKKVAPKRR